MARCRRHLLLLALFLALAAAAPVRSFFLLPLSLPMCLHLPLTVVLISCRVAWWKGRAQSHEEASAVFIDASSHRYLRDQQADGQVSYRISPSKLSLLGGKKEEPTNLLRSVLTLSVIAS